MLSAGISLAIDRVVYRVSFPCGVFMGKVYLIKWVLFVSSVHTMEELKLTGNHLKGSRPILTFSSNFDEEPHWKLLKELIMQVCFFCV